LGSIASQRQTGKRRRYGGEGRRGTAGSGGVRSFDFEGEDESDLVLWIARPQLASYLKAQFLREVGSQANSVVLDS